MARFRTPVSDGGHVLTVILIPIPVTCPAPPEGLCARLPRRPAPALEGHGERVSLCHAAHSQKDCERKKEEDDDVYVKDYKPRKASLPGPAQRLYLQQWQLEHESARAHASVCVFLDVCSLQRCSRLGVRSESRARMCSTSWGKRRRRRRRRKKKCLFMGCGPAQGDGVPWTW